MVCKYEPHHKTLENRVASKFEDFFEKYFKNTIIKEYMNTRLQKLKNAKMQDGKNTRMQKCKKRQHFLNFFLLFIGLKFMV